MKTFCTAHEAGACYDGCPDAYGDGLLGLLGSDVIDEVEVATFDLEAAVSGAIAGISYGVVRVTAMYYWPAESDDFVERRMRLLLRQLRLRERGCVCYELGANGLYQFHTLCPAH